MHLLMHARRAVSEMLGLGPCSKDKKLRTISDFVMIMFCT